MLVDKMPVAVTRVPHSGGSPPPTEDEVQARLHREGYESFRWYDVPGVRYPRHRHAVDECIWVIRGRIRFLVETEAYDLGPGDRIYLPARTPHTAEVPATEGCTYVVGQRN
jgi:quercetin dioxygenase-like cupin family protein